MAATLGIRGAPRRRAGLWRRFGRIGSTLGNTTSPGGRKSRRHDRRRRPTLTGYGGPCCPAPAVTVTHRSVRSGLILLRPYRRTRVLTATLPAPMAQLQWLYWPRPASARRRCRRRRLDELPGLSQGLSFVELGPAGAGMPTERSAWIGPCGVSAFRGSAYPEDLARRTALFRSWVSGASFFVPRLRRRTRAVLTSTCRRRR